MKNKGKKGFTLIELIITSALSGIIMAILAVVINGAMDSWVFMRGQKTLLLESSSAIELMSKEFRRISNSTGTGILQISPTQITFKDIDGNTIIYRQNGSNLERNSLVLLDDLAPSSGLQFSYLNNNGVATDQISSIRTIQVVLIVQKGENLIKLQGTGGIRNR